MAPGHCRASWQALRQTEPMRRLLVPLLVIALASACADSEGSETSRSTTTRATAADAAAPPVLAVGEHTENLVDPSRPTQAPAPAPERTLITTVRFPETGGPYPLIVFAHGFDGHPRKFVELTTAWAQAGYVVAVPRFPLTSDDIDAGVIGDVVEQPADVSFVIDEMLRLNSEAGSVVEDRIDPERIGVAGLSLGAITTLGVTYNSCCRDDRVDAAIAMAGLQYPFDGEFDVTGVPLLLFHGDADPVLPHGSSVDTFAVAAPPKFFVTIIGGSHASPFEDEDAPADAMVEEVSTDFWDVYLADEPGALDRLLTDADVPGLTTVQYDAG
jgi:dienelactone hydrolase